MRRKVSHSMVEMQIKTFASAADSLMERNLNTVELNKERCYFIEYLLTNLPQHFKDEKGV